MHDKIAVLHGQLAGGVLPAMVTPLHEDGYTVNTAVVPDLVDFLIEAQVRGLLSGERRVKASCWHRANGFLFTSRL